MKQLDVLEDYAMALHKDDGWTVGPCTPEDVQRDEGWYGMESKAQQRKDMIARDREKQTLAAQMGWNRSDPRAAAMLYAAAEGAWAATFPATVEADDEWSDAINDFAEPPEQAA